MNTTHGTKNYSVLAFSKIMKCPFYHLLLCPFPHHGYPKALELIALSFKAVQMILG